MSATTRRAFVIFLILLATCAFLEAVSPRDAHGDYKQYIWYLPQLVEGEGYWLDPYLNYYKLECTYAYYPTQEAKFRINDSFETPKLGPDDFYPYDDGKLVITGIDVSDDGRTVDFYAWIALTSSLFTFTPEHVEVVAGEDLVYTLSTDIGTPQNIGPIVSVPGDTEIVRSWDSSWTKDYQGGNQWLVWGNTLANADKRMYYFWLGFTISGEHYAQALSCELTDPPITHTLTVQSSPDSGAYIEVSPLDENNESDGYTPFTRVYEESTNVTLTAPAEHNGKQFYEWQVDGSHFSYEQTIVVGMAADHTAEAVYTAATHTLFVQSSPDSGVWIDVSPPDNNGDAGEYTPFTREYNEPQPVTLAAPETYDSMAFVEWTQDDSHYSYDTTVVVTMDDNHTMVAIYEPLCVLTVESDPTGVYIDVSPADYNGDASDNTPFTRLYYPGTEVTLTAPEIYGDTVFLRWYRDGSHYSYDREAVVTVDDDHTMLAKYIPIGDTQLRLLPDYQQIGYGESFTLDLWIDNVEDLYGFELDVLFDPTCLTCTLVEQGDFLQQGGQTMWQDPTINNETGEIRDMVCFLWGGAEQGVSGSGQLAVIHFTEKKGPPAYQTTVVHDPTQDRIIDSNGEYMNIAGFWDADVDVGDQVLTLLVPNGGEEWCAGSEEEIVWTPIGDPQGINIELYKADSPHLSIDPAAPDTGSYLWTIPADLPDQCDYKIRITSNSDPGVSDESDGYFCIHQPSITVLAPNGGEEWCAGSTQDIMWEGQCLTGDVKIELNKADAFYSEIVASVPCDAGVFSWDIPSDLPDQCDYKVRITSLSDTDVWDESDDYFCIRPPDVWYVDCNAPGPHDGTSWETAFLKIQEGVNAAAPGGEDVWVADCTYVENVNMAQGVSVYGGYAGYGADYPNARKWTDTVSTIDGNWTSSCVTMADGAKLDGFRVINGTGTSMYGHYHGGGILCNELTVGTVIANCVIAQNSAQVGGGLLYRSCSGSHTAYNNTLFGNSAPNGSGGGILCIADSSPVLVNNTICNNTGSEGGGISIAQYSSPIIANNIVASNSGYGIYESLSSPELHYNDVYENSPGNYYPTDYPHDTDISCDPQFVDPANGDFHIAPDSCCVNAGSNAWAEQYVLSGKDFEGDPRIIGDIVDIGADEMACVLTEAPDPEPYCPGPLFGEPGSGFPGWVWFSIPLDPAYCCGEENCHDPTLLLGFSCNGRLWYWDRFGKWTLVYQPPFLQWDLAVGDGYLLYLESAVENPWYYGLVPDPEFRVKLGRQGWVWLGMPGLEELAYPDFMDNVHVEYPVGGMIRTAGQDYGEIPNNWVQWGWAFWDTYNQAPRTFTPYLPFGSNTCYPWLGYRAWINVGTALDEDDPDQVTLIWP